MTSYTENRSYPYPSSEREAANGAAASEALARAVQVDLDVLDAGYAAGLQRPLKIITLAADTGAVYGPSTEYTQPWDTISKIVLPSYFSSSSGEIAISATGAGWYFASYNLRLAPGGTVTLNSRYQMWIRHQKLTVTGTPYYDSQRFGDTWCGTTAVANHDNRISGVFRCEAGDKLIPYFMHGNAGSNVKVVAAATAFEVTRLRGL